MSQFLLTEISFQKSKLTDSGLFQNIVNQISGASLWIYLTRQVTQLMMESQSLSYITINDAIQKTLDLGLYGKSRCQKCFLFPISLPSRLEFTGDGVV